MAVGSGVELDAMVSVLKADEVDVVVGWMSDLQALDDQPWYPQAQLV